MPLAFGYPVFRMQCSRSISRTARRCGLRSAEGELPIHTIGATIGTRVGPGAVAVAFFRPVN